MAGQFRENWKRMANKLPPLEEATAYEDKDLVRIEDLNGFAGLTATSGSLLVGSGNVWTSLPIGPEGYVPKSVGGLVQWQPDASGAGGGGGLVDLTGSGFVVGPDSATDNAIAIYDGETGKLVKNSTVTIDGLGNIVTSGNITVLGDIINSGTVINSVAASTGTAFTISSSYFNGISSPTTSVFMPPTPSSGVTYVIKDVDGTAGATPITINGNGNTIDGSATTQLVSNWEAMTLIFGNAEWNII